MKTIAIVFLSLIAASLIIPAFPLVLPFLVIGFAVMLPAVIILAIGTVFVSLAAGVAKLALGVATIVGLVLLPLFLLLGMSAAFWTCVP